ncbi:MAG: hypothetical protein PHD31_00090 [Candidatus Pacebacteria bacterium]|jgi:hypothetical protein|nr:hypothetical protein [Candidatus Paceibacterota bacterium]
MAKNKKIITTEKKGYIVFDAKRDNKGKGLRAEKILKILNKIDKH